MFKSYLLPALFFNLLAVIGKIIYFPVWWYSIGFLRFAASVFSYWLEELESLSFLVWLKNIFVPMYGQNDFFGRLVSFFMRSVQVFFRGLILLLMAAILILLLAAWLILPLAIIVAVAFQLSASRL